MRLARLSDLALIELARREAQALLQTDPTLERPEHALLAQRLAAFWNTQGDMS
jgi:ATP-dependent DNA helicase RecG